MGTITAISLALVKAIGVRQGAAIINYGLKKLVRGEYRINQIKEKLGLLRWDGTFACNYQISTIRYGQERDSRAYPRFFASEGIIQLFQDSMSDDSPPIPAFDAAAITEAISDLLRDPAFRFHTGAAQEIVAAEWMPGKFERTSVAAEVEAFVGILRDTFEKGLRANDPGAWTQGRMLKEVLSNTQNSPQQLPIGASLLKEAGLLCVDEVFLVEEASKNTADHNPLNFYSHLPKVQWWGVANGLAIESHPYADVMGRLRTSWEHSLPVAAMLTGAGGMGKTVMARLLAQELSGEAQVWWLDHLRMEAYFEDDPEERFESVPGRLLIVIDDWFRMESEDKGRCRKHFARMESSGLADRVKFLITSRSWSQHELPGSLVDAGGVFELGTAQLRNDNERLLMRLQEAFSDPRWEGILIAEAIDLLNGKGLNLERSNPFHLLFSVLRLAQDAGMREQVESGSKGEKKAQAYFKQIIYYDLEQLRTDSDWKGVWKSLLLAAGLYQKMNIKISLESFEKLIGEFGKLPYNFQPSDWKEQVFEPNRKNLHHYISMEEGNNYVLGTVFSLAFNKDSIAEAISELDEQHWQQFRALKNSGMPWLVRQVGGQTANRIFWVQTARMRCRDAIGIEEGRQLLVEMVEAEIQPSYYQNVLIRRNNPLEYSEVERNQMIEKIFETNSINSLLIQGGLELLSDADFRHRKALQFLDPGFWEFNKIPKMAFAACWVELGEEERKSLAPTLLDREHWPWEKLPGNVFSECFPCLDEESRQKMLPNFLSPGFWSGRSFPQHVVLACFEYLSKEEKRLKSLELLDPKIWQGGGLPHELIGICFECLSDGDKPIVSEKLLDSSNWMGAAIPAEIVGSCLEYLPPAAQQALSSKFLEKDSWPDGSIPHQILGPCLGYLEEEEAAQKALAMLDPKFWRDGKLPHHIIGICFAHLEDEDKGSMSNRMMNSSFWPDSVFPKEIFSACFEYLDPSVQREKGGIFLEDPSIEASGKLVVAFHLQDHPSSFRFINACLQGIHSFYLKRGAVAYCFPKNRNWQGVIAGYLRSWRSNREMTGHSLSHAGSPPKEVFRVCREILESMEEELEYLLANPKANYWHLLHALGHPALVNEADFAAWSILKRQEEDPRFHSPRFKTLTEAARRIMEEMQFPGLVKPQCACIDILGARTKN